MENNFVHDSIPLSPDDLIQAEVVTAVTQMILTIEGTALNLQNDIVDRKSVV